MALQFNAELARKAFMELPDLAAQESLKPPQLTRIYVPSQHAKALHLDASVVVGMRGAGKSWWTAVLASEKHRGFVSDQLQCSSLAKVTACVGFGLDDTDQQFPKPESLAAMDKSGIDPVDIWQTVVLRHALLSLKKPLPFRDGLWDRAVNWLIRNRNSANELLSSCDAQLAEADRVLLVLFDAFDRLATDWRMVRKMTLGALQFGLRLRTRQSIRAKFFIRPDLEEDDEVWRFSDSSKLRHTKVDLAWSSLDLYGLVFMHLGNAADFGPVFRLDTETESGIGWKLRKGVNVPPSKVTHDGEVQTRIVEALIDDTMGGGPKRGYTYTWIPLHLADAKGRISPRSYLLAFKKAAEHTAEHRPEHDLAIHYSGIHQGVVKASQVRVDEMIEDYPWIKPLLEAARGSVVPMNIQEVSSMWSPDCMKKMKKDAAVKLPPRRYTNDAFRKGRPEALIDDLVELAVIYRTKDNRINMPDIFRVGFGIRRKGGVKPPK